MQFAMCGRYGKYNPYKVVEPPRRQKILLLINSAPFEADKIAEKLGLGSRQVGTDLEKLKESGLIKNDDNNRYTPAFAIFTRGDQALLDSLVDSLSRAVSEVVEKRMGDVEDLIAHLDCAKNGLKSPDLEYIIIGAMTLDYTGLKVLRDGNLLSPSRKMPGGGDYIFSAIESGQIKLKEGWMWGHNSTFGKYWFSSHGKIPVEGFRMAFPDLAWQWAEQVDQSQVTAEMVKIGEILEVLTRGGFSTMDLMTRLKRGKDRLLIELTLLLTLEYVTLADKRWRIKKSFFTAHDLSRIGGLSHSILKEVSELFKMEQPRVLNVYSRTSPARNGIPFEDAFNLLYHLIFERALDFLIKTEVMAPPPVICGGTRYSSFVAVGIENLHSVLG
jgi:DNA-binding transcriptional ArsR family regulator